MNFIEENSIIDYINSVPFFYQWTFFLFFDIIVYYFIDIDLSFLFAIFMIPIWINDILIKIFKEKK